MEGLGSEFEDEETECKDEDSYSFDVLDKEETPLGKLSNRCSCKLCSPKFMSFAPRVLYIARFICMMLL